MLKEIQSSWNNHNDIGLKIEDTQKLCNKYMLHKYELMVWHKIIWMLLTQEYGNIYIKQIMNSESTSQQIGENIDIINDYELRIGM